MDQYACTFGLKLLGEKAEVLEEGEGRGGERWNVPIVMPKKLRVTVRFAQLRSRRVLGTHNTEHGLDRERVTGIFYFYETKRRTQSNERRETKDAMD